MPTYPTSRSTSEIRQFLKAHNYPHNGPALNFQGLLERVARSLPAYEKCKLAELRKFARQRGLVGVVETTNRKHLVVEALLRADDNPNFPRFLELPAEVRTMIYEFYCAGFADEPLILPTYPPLARTSNLLKKELLPVFFSSCNFGIGLVAENFDSDETRHILRMQRETTLSFRSLKPEHLASIQTLEVSFDSHFRMQPMQSFNMKVTVPRNGTKTSVVIRVLDKFGNLSDLSRYGLTHPWGGHEKGIAPKAVAELEAKVNRFAEGIQQREDGGNHLVIDDVYWLRSTLERFFEDQG